MSSINTGPTVFVTPPLCKCCKVPLLRKQAKGFNYQCFVRKSQAILIEAVLSNSSGKEEIGNVQHHGEKPWHLRPLCNWIVLFHVYGKCMCGLYCHSSRSWFILSTL